MRPPTHTPLRGLVVVWALVLLSLPETPLASVGTCIPWNYTSDSHCVIPGNTFDPILHSSRTRFTNLLFRRTDGTPIFISAQYNLQQLAYQIERSYKGSAFFHASNSCVNAIIAVECASAFRPCLQLENGREYLLILDNWKGTLSIVLTLFIRHRGPSSSATLPIFVRDFLYVTCGKGFLKMDNLNF